MMRLRDLFKVSTGQKVTEKHLRRVLISSICSILLCMSCLAGVTWAWFTVSIENTCNVIQIGEPQIKLTEGEVELESGSLLTVGSHEVLIVHANKPDDLQKKSTLYVTMTIQQGDDTLTLYTTLNGENQYTAKITIDAKAECSFSWNVSWFAPAGAAALTDDVITIAGEVSEESSAQDSSEPSEESSSENESESSEEMDMESSTEEDTESSEKNDSESSATDESESSANSADKPVVEDTTNTETEPSEESTSDSSLNNSTDSTGEESY